MKKRSLAVLGIFCAWMIVIVIIDKAFIHTEGLTSLFSSPFHQLLKALIVFLEGVVILVGTKIVADIYRKKIKYQALPDKEQKRRRIERQWLAYEKKNHSNIYQQCIL
ncbi:MAG: hypothetical protein LUE29_10670 [Lachnospiraceae bacterium]|nr:hypothetical protein [Lachnospiraceae bacterium]